MAPIRSLAGVLFVLALGFPVIATLPDAIASQRATGISIVASGLIHPRGLAWAKDGTLLVAGAGTGGMELADGEESVPPPLGPVKGGPTARISRIVDGCPQPLATHLPSYMTNTGEVGGVADLAVIDRTLYALVTGGGTAHGNPDQPNGVYRVEKDGAAALVANLIAWLQEHPVAHPPQADYDPAGSFFDMVVAPDGKSVLVVESNSQQVLQVSLDGEVTRVADLSGDNQVPTAIALDQSGTIYVGYLSGAPYPDGTARVVRLADDGSVENVWTGLTTVTGLAFGTDGTLYALEMSTGNTTKPPFLTRNSGRLVRQAGADSAVPVVIGLDLPVVLATGPDGAFYVSSPAIGAGDGSGMVLRVMPSGDEPLMMTSAQQTPSSCVSPGDVAAGSTVTVEIYDFGFSPERIEMPAGTTVTWVNTGAVDHTTVAFRRSHKIWDSNIMHPGARFTFTFDQPGTYDYVCGLHPDMKGRIEVR